MAIPYAILTLLPDLLKKLPKAGRWMDLVKHAIGFILLLIAVMLISKEYKILCFTVILSFCIWLAGTCVTFSTPIRKKIIVRLIALLLTLWAGWALLKPKVQIIEWNEYNTAEVEIARSQDRPVLIKFTADWCTSCKVVEMMVYGRQDIADLIKSKNVLAIKADTTEAHYPATVAQETIYKEPGIPVSILHVPDVNESLRWRGISFADELKQALEKIPE
jgi:thiol:disulfide interchange protein DsbD